MANSLLVLLILICALAWLAERLKFPAATLYFVGGALYGLADRLSSDRIVGFGLPTGFLPELPYSSDVVFTVLFPILLYASAFAMPWNDFRVNSGRSVFVGLSNVLVTSLTAGAFVHVLFGVPWLAAMLLGVCLADPDFTFFLSRANSSNTSRPLRRAVAAEGLVEGTAMLLLYVALSDAVARDSFELLPFVAKFVTEPTIGVIVGASVAFAVIPAFRRMHSPPLALAASIAMPFLAFLPAQALGGARLAAVVAAGLVTGARIDPAVDPASRLTARRTWASIRFLVNGAIYVPAGALVAKVFMDADVDWLMVAWGAPSTAIVILAARSGWSAVIWGSFRLFGRAWGAWPEVAMGTLGATRGVFALASAFALPQTLGEGSGPALRDLVIAIVLGATFSSQLLQARIIVAALLRLPLNVDDREQREADRAYASMAEAGLRAIENEPAVPGVDALRLQLRSVLDRFDGQTLSPAPETKAQLAALAAQRCALRGLLESDQISGEIFKTLEGEIDRHETYLRGE